MRGQVVTVKREVLEACMTCPLCNKLLKEATTISLCLHTFCRKCIYEKLSDEEVDCCPVCNINLGCLPVEKLRPDHSLQDIRAKIFPFRRRKIRAPEVMPSIALPTKRKERSLSSLVVSTPKVPIPTGLTGRRSKASTRKVAALRAHSSIVEESNKKEDSAEDHPVSSSLPESPNKIAQKRRQDSLVGEPSSEQMPNEDMEDDVETMDGKADLWKSLNCLVEAANRTKSSKSNSQGLSLAKSDLHNGPDYKTYPSDIKSRARPSKGHDHEVYVHKIKNEHGQDTKVHDDTNGTNSVPASMKYRKLTAARKRTAMTEELSASEQAMQDANGTNSLPASTNYRRLTAARKGAAMLEELSASAQAMLDASGAKNKGRNGPIWLSLVASEDQKGDASLPQISTCYLRIKDDKMPVSFIQKYLVKKLDLASEAEVEVMCRAQPVLPTLQLHNLVDLWRRTASTSKKMPVSVGSSAKDFVMVLSYCRKSNLHRLN